MKKIVQWEYKSCPNIDNANELGKEGWEAFAIASDPEYSNDYFFLKRIVSKP